MATEQTKYLLIGGGLANATAAKTIREKDAEGRIVIVCGEDRMPYNRPPLTKEYLRGEANWDGVRVSPDEEYDKQRIEVRRGVTVTALDKNARTATLSDGTVISYEKACLATGSSPATIDPKVLPGADAPNVHYIRQIDDSDAVRADMETASRVVVLGAGYIGMETTAVFTQLGLDVTVVHNGSYPWNRIASEEFGEYLQGYYEQQGVRFLFNDGATAIVTGADGRATGVRTKKHELLPCDFVIAAVGARLNLDLPRAAGLQVDPKQGVHVDRHLQTTTGGLFAAGDIAFFDDPIIGRRWHVEHWQNAEWHGQVAGANMVGKRTAYNHVPYFFSDVFDLHMTLRGDPQAGESSFPMGAMGSEADRFLELYSRSDGTFAMGLLISKNPDETATSDLLEALFRARVQIAQHRAALQSGEMTLESLAPK